MSDLHRWTDRQGQEWACGAYDHSLLCRLCQPVDGLLSVLLDGVAEGLYEWRVDSTGKFVFKLTPLGTARAEQAIHNTVEGAELWTRLMGLRGEESA